VIATKPGDSSEIKPVGFTAPQEQRDPVAATDEIQAPNGGKPPTPITTTADAVTRAQPTEPKPAHPGAPLRRLVNTKRFTVGFKVNDVGPSGLAGVEVWYTQDGRDWKKQDAPIQSRSYVVEVDEEGIYGFTLIARSGTGLAKDPPRPGDQPQVWVIVDLTKPDIQLTEVTPTFNPGSQQIAIKWKASDKNLGRQPISLYYADKEAGPWKVIATNLENNGKYVWQVPADAPASLLVRAEANDMAGNVSTAQSDHPVRLDVRVPSVSIVNVEANPGR
jgi:hypothetical protein